MTKNRLKRVMALVMAFVLTVGAVIPTAAYEPAAEGESAEPESRRQQTREIKPPIPFLTAYFTGNSAWSRKRK